MKKALFIVALGILFLGNMETASAGTITTFTDRALFDATVGTTTLEDFTLSAHFPIPDGKLDSTTSFGSLYPGDIEAGATYTTPVGTENYFNIDGGAGFTGGFLDGWNPGDRALTITYSPIISAFGFDTNSQMGTIFDITINFISGTSYFENFGIEQNYSMQFFGFQSSLTDIGNIVIAGDCASIGFAIDNHSFGGNPSDSSNVPEPATMLLLGIGLLGLSGFRKRNHCLR